MADDARSGHDAGDAIGAADDENDELSELPLRKLVAVLAINVERLERYLASGQSDRTDQGPAVPSGPELGPGQAATPGKSAAAGEAVAEDREPATPRESSDGGPGAVARSSVTAPEDVRAAAAQEDELLEKWRRARILESSARTELERAVAGGRTLQIEMAIIWERDKTVPLPDT